MYLNTGVQICLQGHIFLNRSENLFESIFGQVFLSFIIASMALLFLSFFFLPKVLDRNIADTEALIQVFGEGWTFSIKYFFAFNPFFWQIIFFYLYQSDQIDNKILHPQFLIIGLIAHLGKKKTQIFTGLENFKKQLESGSDHFGFNLSLIHSFKSHKFI